MQFGSQFIQKAIVINLLLVLYFCCSNLSSFLGIVCAIGMFTSIGVMSFFNKKP